MDDEGKPTHETVLSREGVLQGISAGSTQFETDEFTSPETAAAKGTINIPLHE